jgi:hypothetical protein
VEIVCQFFDIQTADVVRESLSIIEDKGAEEWRRPELPVAVETWTARVVF